MSFSWPRFKSLWKGTIILKPKQTLLNLFYSKFAYILCVSQNTIWGTPTQEEYVQANLIANQHELNAVQGYLLRF